MKDNKRSEVVFGSMRIPFLVLTPTCVAIGAATAHYSGSKLDIIKLALALIGALCAHIGVNALNEYDDFKSGLDFKTIQTPFSGGSKALPSNPDQAKMALVTGTVNVLVTIAIGIYFIYKVGIMIFPLGLLGIIIIVVYTKWITRNPLLCLLAPGIGFGILMVMGTHFVLTGAYSWTAFTASLVPSFLVSDLLLLNQVPDTDADRTIGRKHVPITVGKKGAVYVYSILLACTYISIISGFLAGLLPAGALLAVLTIILAIPTVTGAMKNFDSVQNLVPYMGRNVVLILLTNVLLAVGIFIG